MDLVVAWLTLPALQILDCTGLKISTWRQGLLYKDEDVSECVQEEIFKCVGLCKTVQKPMALM